MVGWRRHHFDSMHGLSPVRIDEIGLLSKDSKKQKKNPFEIRLTN